MGSQTQEEAKTLKRQMLRIAEDGAWGGTQRRVANTGIDMARLWWNFRYTVRNIRRAPRFTALIVMSLALGIGANTAIFTLLDTVFMRSLPVKHPRNLVIFKWSAKESVQPMVTSGYSQMEFTYPMFQRFRDQHAAFSYLFGSASLGFSAKSVAVSVDGETSAANGEMVTGEFFHGLGVPASVGRILSYKDGGNVAPIAVISYAYWLRQFARDPGIAGRVIYLNAQPYTIIGVAAHGFTGVRPGQPVDLWIPVTNNPALRVWDSTPPPGQDLFTSRTWCWMTILGRLGPHVTARQATSELAAVFQSEIRDATGGNAKLKAARLELVPGNRGLDSLRRRYSKPLCILMGLVTLGLLAGCANVATLLLTRASGRRREMAIRLANGASRASLVRQLLSESAILSAIGGLLGLLFASWGTRALVGLLSTTDEAIALDLHADAAVLTFTLIVSLATAVLFGLSPAIQTTRVDIASTLKESASTIAGGGRKSWWDAGNAFVVTQLALSLILLVGAGLFAATLRNLEYRDLGFDKRNLLLFAVDPPRNGIRGDALPRFYSTLLERLQTLPAVQSATMSRLRLIADWRNESTIMIDDHPVTRGQERDAQWNAIGPGFFETMRIPLLAGRGINAGDRRDSPPVAVVNRAFAEYYFPGMNPIGHRIRLIYEGAPKTDYSIVGVSGTALFAGLREGPLRTFYLPYTQLAVFPTSMNYELRTASDPGRITGYIRDAVEKLAPGLLLSGMETQTEQIDETLVDERVFAQLANAFSILVLLLGAVGLYGTMAYAVTRRTSEIGIRMALGAMRKDILAMIFGKAAVLVITGAALGGTVAILATRLIASVLFGVRPGDARTMILSAAILIVVSAIASFLPARRAVSVDPLRALRWE